MGTDSISSDALLLLLETVNKQAAQIKRLESLAAGDTFTYDTHRPTGLNNDRAFKQLQQVQSSVQSLEQQHAASCSSNKALTEQLHKMEERIQQLESQGRSLQQQGQQLQQQLGSPAQSRSILHGQHRPASSTYMSITSAGGMSTADDPAAGSAQAVGHGAAPGGRSMAARLSKLEQQVDNLTATASNTAERLQSASSAVQALDEELSQQLQNIRADVKQAITVANSSLRADLGAAAQARQQEDATQLKAQLKSLASELDSLVASSQRTLIVNLTAELERRTTAVKEASDGHIAALRSQLDRLEEEKADVTLVTQYTGQVADVFEQLATTVADSTQASIAQLMTQQQELRNLATNLSASKADSSSLLQHQHHCQQQLLELQRGLAAAQSAASEAAIAAAVAKTALEPIDSLRLQLAETQGTVGALQATAAGLEAATNSNCSEQQQQAQQLQQLASSHHMLQQQLLALTNHVDPAAAAQLAAAAAGDESALNFHPLGPCGSLLPDPVFEGGQGTGVWAEGWASGSYLQGSSQAGGHPGTASATGASAYHTSTGGWYAPAHGAGVGASSSGAAAAGAAGSGGGGPMHSSGEQLQHTAGDAAAGPAAADVPSIQSSSNGDGTPGTRAAAAGRGFVDRMSAVLRHLPVAVRLLRLETAVRDLHSAMGQKAHAGEVQGLQQQLESISDRLISGLDQLEGVSSSSMRRLEEQADTLVDAVAALGDSLDERPTHSDVQAALSAASKSAVEPLQQQLAGLTAELDAVKARLRGAGQDLLHLKDWQVQASQQVEALQQAEQHVRKAGQQLQEQVAADLSRQHQEVQQQLTRHTAEVTRDTIKQLKADQEAMQGGSAEAHARVSSLESKLKVVVAEVDSMQEQAALTARLQDKHTDMMAAFEAALSAQSSKYATVSKQLRLELKEALVKANQVHADKAAALESSLKEQRDALSDLAASMAGVSSKGGLLEAALKGAKVTVEELLSQHKKQEEGRWEVWLAEFARAMEQRPTAGQLQKQLQAVQQAAESSAHEAAAQRIQCVTAAMEAGLRHQLHAVQQQLGELRDRTQTLEQGTGIGESYGHAFDVRASSDSPDRMHLQLGKATAGFGSSKAAGLVHGTAAACAATADAAVQADVASDAEAAAEAEAQRVSVAAIVAAFEGSPAPPGARDPSPARTGTAATSTAPSPAPPVGEAAARSPSPADAQSAYLGDTSPVNVHWRQLPVASSVLAEATGAAAAAAAASPGVDSSVAARAEGDSSTSAATVEGSSTGSSYEDDSGTPGAPLFGLPAAHAAAGAADTAAQPAVSTESCASRPDGAATAVDSRHAGTQHRGSAAAQMGTQLSMVAVEAASPSVNSLSPDYLGGFTATSRPWQTAAVQLPAAFTAAAARQPGVMQAYYGAADSSSTPPRRPPQQQQQQIVPQVSPMRALSTTETTECASELQQLLDLQQQVQQCLVDSGCVAVQGRRAKPPKDRQSKKGHKRTRVHSRQAAGVPEAAAQQETAAEAAAEAAAAAGPEEADFTQEVSEQTVSGVDAAIAAAAAAFGNMPCHAPAAAAAGAGMPDRQTAEAPSSALLHHQQQQPHLPSRQQAEQQQQQPEEQQAGMQAAALQLPLARPDRSQEIRSLLTLQQQLAQCLREHGCFLEQQRQQQQQQPAAGPFMAAAGASTIAGLHPQPQHQEPPQQQQYGLQLWGQQQQDEQGGLQQQQQQQQGQRYNVQEVELERLLMLQAQLQQAVRHQSQ